MREREKKKPAENALNVVAVYAYVQVCFRENCIIFCSMHAIAIAIAFFSLYRIHLPTIRQASVGPILLFHLFVLESMAN